MDVSDESPSELLKDREKENYETMTKVNRLSIEIGLRPSQAKFELSVTPVGLLAVGAMVGAILLSVVPIVTAATRHLQDR